MKRIFKTISMNRKQVYDEAWSAPLTVLAKKYSLNYSELPKALNNAGIPYPGSGFWQKKKWDKLTDADIVPLPESEKDVVDLPLNEYDLVDTEIQEIQKWSDNVLPDMEYEKRRRVLQKAETIRFDPDIKLHDVLLDYKIGLKIYRSGGTDRSHYGKYSNGQYREKPYFVDEVSQEGLDRAIQIMNNLFAAIEELGDSVDDDLALKIGRYSVVFRFKETTEITKHILTKQEEKALEKYQKYLEKGRYAMEPKINKYDYNYSGRLRFSLDDEERIYDTKMIRLEERLGEMLIMIYEKAEKKREYREREERYRRHFELREQKRQEERAKRVDETEKIQNLLKEAADYKISCNIRDYITAVVKKEGSSVDPGWIEWANRKADWYDPTVNAEDPLLGKRKRNILNDLDNLSEYTKIKPYSRLEEDDLLPLIDW